MKYDSTSSAPPYEPTTGWPAYSGGGVAPSTCSWVMRAGALLLTTKSNLGSGPPVRYSTPARHDVISEVCTSAGFINSTNRPDCAPYPCSLTWLTPASTWTESNVVPNVVR